MLGNIKFIAFHVLIGSKANAATHRARCLFLCFGLNGMVAQFVFNVIGTTNLTNLTGALEVRLREARMGSFRLWQAESYVALNSSDGHERGLKMALHRLRFLFM